MQNATTITISPEARATMTDEQWEAIKRMLNHPSVESLRIMKGGFDLPDGYITFQQIYPSSLGATSTYGGIAPDGSVST